VQYSKADEMLVAKSINVGVCECCGDMAVFGYDHADNRFVVLPISPEIAMKLAGDLVEQHDKAIVIRAGLGDKPAIRHKLQ
jgi:hypothetical protein